MLSSYTLNRKQKKMNMNILCVIPARSGSKSIHNKNIVDFNGIPLLAHSILHAKQSKYINRIIVSTDSRIYKDIAIDFGADVPFIRPDAISGDDSLDIDLFIHVLEFLESNEGYKPELVVHLRPTYPNRDPSDIDKMIDILIRNKDADSIRSVTRSKETPFKMWYMEDNYLVPIIKSEYEHWNYSRQSLIETYTQNASIDVIRTKTITDSNSMTGKLILGFLMDNNFDIDTISDLAVANNNFLVQSKRLSYAFDFDEIIVIKEINNKLSIQVNNNIVDLINTLYYDGNKITIIFSASILNFKISKPSIRLILKNNGVCYTYITLIKDKVDLFISNKSMFVSDLQRAKK